MINIKTVILGEIAENCYIVTDSDTGRTAVIDPGEYTPELDNALSQVGFDTIDYILLTHGHFDHIGGAAQLLKKTEGKASVAIYKTEADFLSDPRRNLSGAFMRIPIQFISANLLISDGEVIALGSSKFTVIHTPGHTSGSVCFVCGNNIFSGDTLFRFSAGRTDFPTGNEKHLMQSLQKLAFLDGDYIVYTGHGSKTTLAEERRRNPYLSFMTGY